MLAESLHCVVYRRANDYHCHCVGYRSCAGLGTCPCFRTLCAPGWSCHDQGFASDDPC